MLEICLTDDSHEMPSLILFSLNNYKVIRMLSATISEKNKAQHFMQFICLVQPLPGQQYSFMEIDYEIFSMVILFFPLIQGQFLAKEYA